MRKKVVCLSFEAHSLFIKRLQVAFVLKKHPELVKTMTRRTAKSMVDVGLWAISPQMFMDPDSRLTDSGIKAKADAFEFFSTHTDIALEFMQFVRGIDPVMLWLAVRPFRRGQKITKPISSMTDGEIALAIEGQTGTSYTVEKIKSTRQDLAKDLNSFVMAILNSKG